MTPRTMSLKLTPEEVAAFQACADEMGLSRHAWMVLVLRVAAGLAPVKGLLRVKPKP